MEKPVVAITNPYIWPHVRRGSERMLNDLSHYLSQRGYPIEVYAMAPEAKRWRIDSIAYTTIKQQCQTRYRQFNDCHYFAFALQSALKNSRADLVHCLNYFDAFAAIKARTAYRLEYKICFHAVGIPTQRYFRSVPLDKWFFGKTLAESDQVFVLSSFARDRLQQEFGCHAKLLPPPVHVDASLPPAAVARSGAPKILFVGDLLEPRKGVTTLCRAFIEVKARYPRAELLFSGNVSEAFRQSLYALPGIDNVKSSIQFLGLGQVDSLRQLYASATVTVLPSVWEAFGLVLVESLAMGTPVVGTRHAGISDIVNNDRIGRLFEPGNFARYSENSRGLADAISEVIELSAEPSTASACHRRAVDFSWHSLGCEYESWYRSLLGYA